MKLEEYRKKYQMSYDELSDLLGVKRTTAYNICNNITKSISLSTAQKILERTHGEVTYNDLLTTKEN